MDAEGGRAVHRVRGAGRLAVLVMLQNALVVACLVVTLFVYWDYQKLIPDTQDTVHISFAPITVSIGNKTLQFSEIISSSKMDTKDKKMISIKCTGPYIWYVHTCYKSMISGQTANAMLQLQVPMRNTSTSFVTLNTSEEVCRGHQSTVYLREKEECSVYFSHTNGFRLINVTVGLSYLLGKRCEY